MPALNPAPQSVTVKREKRFTHDTAKLFTRHYMVINSDGSNWEIEVHSRREPLWSYGELLYVQLTAFEVSDEVHRKFDLMNHDSNILELIPTQDGAVPAPHLAIQPEKIQTFWTATMAEHTAWLATTEEDFSELEANTNHVVTRTDEGAVGILEHTGLPTGDLCGIDIHFGNSEEVVVHAFHHKDGEHVMFPVYTTLDDIESAEDVFSLLMAEVEGNHPVLEEYLARQDVRDMIYGRFLQVVESD